MDSAYGGYQMAVRDRVLSMIFTKTGPRQGVAAAVDGRPAGGKEPITTARYLIGWQGLVLGRDALSPVSWDYPRGFPFTGTIDRVCVELDDDIPDTTHETFD
ncbi:hypothetical protein ACGFNP_51615 [Nonomuraea sp. NPDC049269]|uniref:hypothetical protein n=1 Tax=Nonomuraea sp. NPDC049269 TaxID=3364349 RepID=UPI0037118B1C